VLVATRASGVAADSISDRPVLGLASVPRRRRGVRGTDDPPPSLPASWGHRLAEPGEVAAADVQAHPAGDGDGWLVGGMVAWPLQPPSMWKEYCKETKRNAKRGRTPWYKIRRLKILPVKIAEPNLDKS